MIARVRVLASGGIVGPSAFVAAWMFTGAATPRYSPIDAAISDLAAVDSSTRVAMTWGFIVFGLGLVAFGLALRETLAGGAWIAAFVTGVATRPSPKTMKPPVIATRVDESTAASSLIAVSIGE